MFPEVRGNQINTRKLSRLRQLQIHPKPRIHPTPIRLLSEQQIVLTQCLHRIHRPLKRLGVAALPGFVVQVKPEVVHPERIAEGRRQAVDQATGSGFQLC